MNLDPLPVKQLLREYGLQLKKSLGQNFLVDETYLHKIVESAEISSEDEVLEIGAGIGSLTRYIVQSAGRVTAVEIDQELVPILDQVLENSNNTKIIKGDIMDLGMEYLVLAPGYKVVANIPYYLTSNLIRKLLSTELKPKMLALTIQKEVAERICSGVDEMSLLSLSVQLYGDPRIAFNIPASAFFPVPKVNSSFLIVDMLPQPRMNPEFIDTFFTLARTAFTQKRKMLHNSLVGAPGIGKEDLPKLLELTNIDGRRRPQTISIGEWSRLAQTYRGFMDEADQLD